MREIYDPYKRRVFRGFYPPPSVRPAVSAVSDYSSCPRMKRRSRIGDDTWILDYSFSDAGLYSLESKDGGPWRQRLAREAHLYAPRSAHWDDTRQVGHFFHSIYIIFLGGEVAGLDGLVHPQKQAAVFQDHDGQLGDLLQQIAQIGRLFQATDFWHAQSVFCRMISLLHRAERVDDCTFRILPLDSPALASPLVTAVLDFFETAMDRHVAISDIARLLHISPSSLAHRYRTETGESPMQTLQRMRLRRAKHMLCQGHPIKTIAVMTGFSDEYHFSKTFKRLTRQSPHAFRHQAQPASL